MPQAATLLFCAPVIYLYVQCIWSELVVKTHPNTWKLMQKRSKNPLSYFSVQFCKSVTIYSLSTPMYKPSASSIDFIHWNNFSCLHHHHQTGPGDLLLGLNHAVVSPHSLLPSVRSIFHTAARMIFQKWKSDHGSPLSPPIKTLQWHPIVHMVATVFNRATPTFIVISLHWPASGLLSSFCSFPRGECLKRLL